MFTSNNTTGYTSAQLEALNAELAIKLQGVEAHTDEYNAIVAAFSDEIANR